MIAWNGPSSCDYTKGTTASGYADSSSIDYNYFTATTTYCPAETREKYLIRMKGLFLDWLDSMRPPVPVKLKVKMIVVVLKRLLFRRILNPKSGFVGRVGWKRKRGK